MATPHNQAEFGQIAKTVLMPGDPLRAKYIAENFLDDPVEFNSVRNMLGYTGTYKGKRVSVMGSGMGIPSISLYAHELYSFYGVENIIRVGSAGAFDPDMQVFDTILVTGAYSESSYAIEKCSDHDKIQYPDQRLNEDLRNAAGRLGIELHERIIWSSDVFYYEDSELERVARIAKENDIAAAEMESFGLFATARVLGKRAACILTVSDSIVNHVETTAQERQTCLINMIKIALEAVEGE